MWNQKRKWVTTNEKIKGRADTEVESKQNKKLYPSLFIQYHMSGSGPAARIDNKGKWGWHQNQNWSWNFYKVPSSILILIPLPKKEQTLTQGQWQKKWQKVGPEWKLDPSKTPTGTKTQSKGAGAKSKPKQDLELLQSSNFGSIFRLCFRQSEKQNTRKWKTTRGINGPKSTRKTKKTKKNNKTRARPGSELNPDLEPSQSSKSGFHFQSTSTRPKKEQGIRRKKNNS